MRNTRYAWLKRTATLIALACAQLALPAQAEEVVIKCYFDWSCDINRKCQDADIDVRFRADAETGTVKRIGGGAMSQLDELELILGDRAITILEKPISGGAATTTLMISNGDAVRSENLITGIRLTPMQYLGQCQTV
ncbi:hypothetical protein RXV86_05910 [Alisedimentitalea sp. MJ-SS2]|uniref:hypothetical protein n=1 Tax=Aliisedimentitalea sp. MJ-SS2 TaxID=3049795 RepID=UPI0029118260|nr:hypothetical protein [Alisedimentitalea sp. MJ-SS2]MDU8926912.1 hypothetical protein [Alisedimentitalea sp. MJ-SS2]